MKKKRYEIVTIEDALNCMTEKNYEAFLIDLNVFLIEYLSWVIAVREYAKKNNVDISEYKKNSDVVVCKKMIWIDDGKHNVAVNLKKVKK